MGTQSKVSFRASGVPWLFDLLWLLGSCSSFTRSVPPMASPGSSLWLLLCTPSICPHASLTIHCDRRGPVLYLLSIESVWPQSMVHLVHKGERSLSMQESRQWVRKSKYSLPFLRVLSLVPEVWAEDSAEDCAAGSALHYFYAEMGALSLVCSRSSM